MNRVLRMQEALAEEIETALPRNEEKLVSEETVIGSENSAPVEETAPEVFAETPEAEASGMPGEQEADEAPSDGIAAQATADAVEAAAEATPEDAAVETSEAAEADGTETAEAGLVAAEEEGAAAEGIAAKEEDLGALPAELSAEGPANTAHLQDANVHIEHLRMTEALLFAASEPLSEEALKGSLPEGADVPGLIAELQKIYEKRGVTLVCVAQKWQFRTAPDLAFLLRKEKPEQKKLSRAAIETLSIIAYHQPVTRAEIEDIRGVMVSKGTLDTLMEVGWIKIRGRKRTPGRPVTYGTTEAFLVQFGLENIGHLPGMDELKAAGFLEAVPPSGMDIPSPRDMLGPDEDPYEGPDGADLATGGADPFIPGSSTE